MLVQCDCPGESSLQKDYKYYSHLDDHTKHKSINGSTRFRIGFLSHYSGTKTPGESKPKWLQVCNRYDETATRAGLFSRTGYWKLQWDTGHFSTQ